MKRALLSVLMLGGLLGGCVTANVDEMTFDAPVAGMTDGSIVILVAVMHLTTTPNPILSTASAIPSAAAARASA